MIKFSAVLRTSVLPSASSPSHRTLVASSQTRSTAYGCATGERHAHGSLGGSGRVACHRVSAGAALAALSCCLWRPGSACGWSRHPHSKNTPVLPICSAAFFPPLLSGQMFTLICQGPLYPCGMGHPPKDTSCWGLNLNIRWDMLWRNKRQPVLHCWNQPFTKSDQFLFQITFTRCNSNCFTCVAVISIVPAIAWHEVVSLSSQTSAYGNLIYQSAAKFGACLQHVDQEKLCLKSQVRV